MPNGIMIIWSNLSIDSVLGTMTAFTAALASALEAITFTSAFVAVFA
jgi:hypothetical protein